MGHGLTISNPALAGLTASSLPGESPFTANGSSDPPFIPGRRCQLHPGCDRSGIATTDRRQPARPLLAVFIPAVRSAIFVHDIRTVGTGIPRAAVAAAAVTDGSTPTTRVSEGAAVGGAATSVNATDVDRHFVSPMTTTIPWPDASAHSRPAVCRLCMAIVGPHVVGNRQIFAVGVAVPGSTSAKSTRATVVTTHVASGRNNVLWCAGTKGISATRGRLQVRVAPGKWRHRIQGAGHRSTNRVVPTGSGMCPFFSPRGVRGRQLRIIVDMEAGVIRLDVHVLAVLHVNFGCGVQNRGCSRGQSFLEVRAPASYIETAESKNNGLKEHGGVLWHRAALLTAQKRWRGVHDNGGNFC